MIPWIVTISFVPPNLEYHPIVCSILVDVPKELPDPRPCTKQFPVLLLHCSFRSNNQCSWVTPLLTSPHTWRWLDCWMRWPKKRQTPPMRRETSVWILRNRSIGRVWPREWSLDDRHHWREWEPERRQQTLTQMPTQQYI